MINTWKKETRDFSISIAAGDVIRIFKLCIEERGIRMRHKLSSSVQFENKNDVTPSAKHMNRLAFPIFHLS